MTEVTLISDIEQMFTASISRLFGVECRYIASGDLVCIFAFRSVRHRTQVGTEIRIGKDQLNNPEYVAAAIQVGIDAILGKMLK